MFYMFGQELYSSLWRIFLTVVLHRHHSCSDFVLLLTQVRTSYQLINKHAKLCMIFALSFSKKNNVINAMNLLKLLLSENRSQLKTESSLGMNPTSLIWKAQYWICYKCARGLEFYVSIFSDCANNKMNLL